MISTQQGNLLQAPGRWTERAVDCVGSTLARHWLPFQTAVFNSCIVAAAITTARLPLLSSMQALCKKLAPPLVTLTLGSNMPEIQYCALRNINLIVQRRPHVLNSEYKVISQMCILHALRTCRTQPHLLLSFFQVFFCKYNDPVYVKLEKLEIIIRLASDRNIDAILTEVWPAEISNAAAPCARKR